jgi:hypothetical protein
MSLDDLRDADQLEALAGELAEAGRIARTVSSRREVPDAAFVTRLRAELLRSLPQAGSLSAGPSLSGMTMALPLASPFGAPQRLTERRARTRPFSDARLADQGSAGAAPVAPASSGKRWRARQVQAIAAAPTAAPTALPGRPGVPQLPPDDRNGHVAVLRPAISWRIPGRPVAGRWVAVGLAASVAIASLLVGGTLLFPVGPDATASDVTAATYQRGGVSNTLAAGQELRPGDEIQVGASGRATLLIGNSFVRLAPGSDMRLDDLDRSHVVVSQLNGRAYHRVSVADGGSYTVRTDAVSWVATGSAFDLDRHAVAADGEEVRGLALLDSLDLRAPQLTTNLNQGQSAVIALRGPSSAGQPFVSQISRVMLSDAWLVRNAGLDHKAGLALGELTVSISPSPEPSEVIEPSSEPTTETTAEPTVPATDTPTQRATAAPTHKPTPRPTASGPHNLGKLTIVNNGDGTYSFSWPKYTGEGFTYYKLLYGPAGSSPTYGAADYWACNSDPAETSYSGAIPIGDYAVRLQVVDETGSTPVVRAQTGIVHLEVQEPAATEPAVQSLGVLSVSPDGANYVFGWDAYTGGFGFDAYKLVWVAWDGSPSYLHGDPYEAFGTGSTSSGSISMPSGDWSVRVQAIGSFNGHTFAFGQTGILHLIVP